MKKSLLFLLLSVSLVGLTINTVNTVLAAEFEGVGGVPAYPIEGDSRTKDWFIYSLNPGDSKEDAVIVINNSSKATNVILYSADSTPSTDGGFALKQLVEDKVDVGKWITLSKTELTLPPHGSELVPFKIEVPKDPMLDVGEHTGGIMIQKTNQQDNTKGGMTLLMRVGVRVYVTIPGEVIKKLEIEKFDVQLNPEKKVYTAALTIKNTGNVSQNVTLNMRVSNALEWLNGIPFVNLLFKDFPAENARDLQVLRGDSLTSNFEFKKPLFGKLKLEGSAQYDNKTKTLTAEPVMVDVPLDRGVLILIVLFVAFIVSLFAMIVLKKRDKKDGKKAPKNKSAPQAAPRKSAPVKPVLKKNNHTRNKRR